ncbi:MAG: CHAT domain-containing protein, partial [Holophagales bacterium]|nr:CHAT domain-containing protein [Holophagales bacterium]
AASEARGRLDEAFEECARLRRGRGEEVCSPALASTARGTWVWLTLLDGDATPEQLAAALGHQLKVLEPVRAPAEAGDNSADGGGTWPSGGLAEDPLEAANQWLNLAYLRLRSGEKPNEALAQAQAWLARGEGGGERRRQLLGWSRLLRGQAALAEGDAERAAQLCAALLTDSDTRLAAWAWSCVGLARQRLGQLDDAAVAFDEALLRHEAVFGWQMARVLPHGPGQRALDYARAARVAVERDRPERAWEILARLDRLSVAEAARRSCRARAAGEDERQRWDELEAASARMLDTLNQLDGPAPLERQRQRQRLTRQLETRLRDLWRDFPQCAELASAAGDVGDAGLHLRAIPLEDEILLLERTAEGVAARRTPVTSSELHERLSRLEALVPHSTDVEAWRRQAEPFARALAPSPPWRRRTVYALHGRLQAVPLAALPVDGGWLGQKTLPVLQPAGAEIRDRQPRRGRAPLFVVDPSGNLATAAEMLRVYRGHFPEARLLQGEAATHGAVTAALATARWLHVDAHGAFDAALPELSSLRLADRPLHWLELARSAPSLEFANLSGCRTGRWPVSADSGSYGLAGLFTRLGTPWAVGSRTDLGDATAAELNRHFYRALAAGAGTADAFAAGLERLMESQPPAAWAGLLLLRAAPTGTDPRQERAKRPAPGMERRRGGEIVRPTDSHAPEARTSTSGRPQQGDST